MKVTYDPSKVTVEDTANAAKKGLEEDPNNPNPVTLIHDAKPSI
jgi:hypothetical protein